MRADVVAAGRALLGEGPAWDARCRRLLWVDIPAGVVHLLDPSTGDDRRLQVGQPVGAVVPDRDGGWAVAVRDGFGRLDDQGGFELVHDLSRPGLRMNDGKCSPDGAFWAGTMAEDARSAVGVLYRMPPAWGRPEPVLDGLTISNGLSWSPDGRSMYFIDTPTRRIDVFDVEPGGAALGNRRPLVEVPAGAGNPDGMTIDEEGCIWVALAHAGRVQRYRPDGTPDLVVEVPVPQVTSCCFGGDRGDVLYMTSGRRGAAPSDPLAGAVFGCHPGVGGPPAGAYG
ncbi:MAG TPA: SMP-30/gluconolactonase/LRE family protein [Acidimicrobiales bacterium]|nr:SMP-30/gluconolactonase/LRE family protein [Acidimicrobiales bacterium]